MSRANGIQGATLAHTSPPLVVGNLALVNDALVIPMDGQSDALFTFAGTYAAGAVAQFEWSADSVDGVGGTWWPLLVRQMNTTTSGPSQSRTLGASEVSAWWGPAPFASYARARISTAPTTGTIAMTGTGSTVTRTLNTTVDGSVTATAVPAGLSEQAETTVTLAAGATYTGTTRDLGTNTGTRATLVRPVVMHTAGLVPGTLILQESTDGTTWRETRRSPIPSDTSYRSFEWPVHMRYYRFLFVNGGTAQTGFYLFSTRVQGEAGTMDAKSNLSFLLTTTALAASGTFTSAVLDLGDNHIFDVVRLRVHTDQATLANGARIETSHDGVNFGYALESAATKAADARIVSLQRPITERYLRLVVENNTVAQTFLRGTLALISL